MPVEIERKFLVRHDGWRGPEPGQRLHQGYLRNGEVTIRVRRAGSRGYLTIKGERIGCSRPEFEYEIPADEAEELLGLCRHALIDKVRHNVLHAGMLWHVDEFAGENTGLVLAEVELRHVGQPVVLPDWVGTEVTSDPRYRNSRLADTPWRKEWDREARESRPPDEQDREVSALQDWAGVFEACESRRGRQQSLLLPGERTGAQAEEGTA